jgi:hypothetical protein
LLEEKGKVMGVMIDGRYWDEDDLAELSVDVGVKAAKVAVKRYWLPAVTVGMLGFVTTDVVKNWKQYAKALKWVAKVFK